ncbi:MAG: HAMP domain-containing sensor histidine kinase [Thermoguttaceae bacterium]
MDAIFDNLTDMLGVIDEQCQDGSSSDRAAEWLQSGMPSLLLVADASGTVIAREDFGKEVAGEYVESLAKDLADDLDERQACRREITLDAGRHVALAVRSSEGPDHKVLACAMPLDRRLVEPVDPWKTASLLCGLFARAAVHNNDTIANLQTRIEHLRNEHTMLKASHAEATATALEEHDQRLRQQEKHTALEALCEATEAADQAKTLFLANMSHELRTPLHGMLSFATFGIKKIKTASRESLLRYFTKIDESGKMLLTLLNDLLDLSKLESGKMTFEFVRLDMGILIESIADEFSSLTALRKLAIEVQLPEIGIPIIGDQIRLMQVIRNLLSNAVKFSPDEGTIRIVLQRQADGIQLSVHDQGIGIPEDELEEIFDKFIQSSKTSTEAGGTGLGLSICMEIVEAHKGRIWAENNPGGGAAIHCRIPTDLNKVKADEPAEAEKAAAE